MFMFACKFSKFEFHLLLDFNSPIASMLKVKNENSLTIPILLIDVFSSSSENILSFWLSNMQEPPVDWLQKEIANNYIEVLEYIFRYMVASQKLKG